MKSIVALVLSLNFCVSVAKAVEVTQASDQFVDKQAEYKEAFERAQAYHEQTLHRLRFEKPATIEEQQISVIQSIKLSTTETRNYLQNFWSNLINMPVIESVRGAWKKFSGTLSTPPVATGLFYIFNTAGTVPEVLWIPDGAYDPDGTIDRFEFDFGDGTSQVIPYADFDSAKTVSHVYAANGTYNASVKIVDNSGDFSMYYGSVTVVSNNQLPVPKFAMQYNQVPNFLKLDLTSQATDDNGIIRHTWRFGDGSSDSVGTSNTSVSRTYTNPGMYLIQYVVRDSHRGQITGWTHAYVGQPQPPGGSYPMPLIYADTHAGVAPLQVNFDGEKSFDVGGSIASYEWNFGDFSHPKNISYQAKPSFRYTQPGTYYGSLKVTDNGGRFNTRYFAVYVSPAAPNTLEPAEITVIPNAAARSFSFDSNYRSIHASVPSYYQIWDFGDGTPIVKGSYPTHVYGSEGTYTVTLRVYDVKGGFQQIQKNLIVGSNQSSPTSTFYADNPNTKVLTPINFITSNPTWVSPTTTAKWSFGDGTVQTGLHKDLLNVSHTYTQRGLYPVDLVVTDEFGKSSYYTIYVNIQTSSQPINAMIDLSARVGKIPLPIRFDASESSSSAGAISNYYWRIAGPSGIQTSQSKVWTNNYTTGGERYVDLYVEDNQGNSGWASDVFAAIDPAQVPAGNNIPVANVQLDFSFNGASTMIHPSGWFSNDPDGDRIVSYEWILDGSPVSSKPNFSYNLNGTLQHLLALRVTDKWGAVGERKVSFKNPQVSFDFAPTKPVFSEPVYFTADEETIKLPDGNQPVSFEWDFGDGTSVQNGQTVNHIFTAAGSYNVRLKMLDNWQRAYYVFKNVNIYNPDTFTAIISAKTADGIEHGKSGGIISSMRFPDTIIFDLYESDVVGEGVKSATWDFGNGNTGFGLTPEFTYQQPGVYTVSVNATDSNNNTSVSTMQVKILSWDCSDSDGVNGCLKLVNAQGNVFPMSPSEWIITHDTGGTQTWTPDIGDTDYVELIPLDDSGGAASINITSAIVLDGQNLKIQKSVLQSLNIDFYKEYQLDVHTKLSDGKNYFGTFPRVVFGVGTVDISAAESDVQIVVKGAKGFTKYLDLGANLTYQLKELPIDSYSFVATKDTRRQIYHLTVTNSSVLNLAVDLSAVSIKERDENWKDYFPKFNKAVPKYLMNEGENWQQDGCGNPSPFPLAIDGPRPGRGISAVWLSSKSGENQITNRKLTKAFGKELKMYCAISSKYNEYELNKYMTVGAVGRCDIDPQGAAYAWSWYLSAYGGMASLPVTVRWTIVDDASAKQTSGSYNTTLAEAMRSNGIQPENINTKIGTVDHAGTMHLWGPNFKPKVKIPGNFLRPRMSMTMQGLHSVAPNPWYQVSCQIEKEDEILPRVLDVVTADLPASIQMHSPIDNGKRFLTGKFFPIGIDDTLTSMSGSFKLPDIFKAKIKLKMHSGTGYPEDVDRIKIKLRYDDQEVGSHTYSLAQQNYEDVLPGSSNFSIVLDLDADDFKSMVAYVPGVKDKKLSFEFIPLGPELPEEKAGAFTVSGITPLFDMKKQRISQDADVFCKYGIFNSHVVSMYAASKLMNDIYTFANDMGINFRCNDASLPWGGLFFTQSARHTAGHRNGINIDVRYFNPQNKQDSYDQSYAALRILDLNEYLKLSHWASTVAAASTGDLYDKKELIFNKCKNNGSPLYPCTIATLIGDITNDKILKLCQWHKNEFESTCASGASNYAEAILRYSTWVEYNLRDLRVIKKKLSKLRMSDGSLFPISMNSVISELKKDWQRQAIERGLWPDGTPIYKMNGNTISTYRIDSCHSDLAGCALSENFKYDDVHINHIHMEY